MTDKSATERLREMLDECGVEYETDDRNGLRETIWCGTAVFQLSPTAKMTMIATPEQAIAATLRSEFNPDGLPVGLAISDDGNLLNWRGENYVRQSALGGGECELVYGENDYGDDGWWCQACGEWFAASFRHTGRNNIVEPNHCQRCGRKAVKR